MREIRDIEIIQRLERYIEMKRLEREISYRDQRKIKYRDQRETYSIQRLYRYIEISQRYRDQLEMQRLDGDIQIKQLCIYIFTENHNYIQLDLL